MAKGFFGQKRIQIHCIILFIICADLDLVYMEVRNKGLFLDGLNAKSLLKRLMASAHWCIKKGLVRRIRVVFSPGIMLSQK